ncbi:ABC transporter ATP-binding protein [Bradyrhizobium symbiodeficiens]|uniref:ABC transporter ATP-binding protein n=1 Tax=Bradyrhizobium symbiodeficiens TaxID=1404367 RepID=A0ABX5W2J9_9BRAD|nr:ABC transporter ATP-binding protein [Bradyrhizobium symbiodeficiens]QDF37488.1 ABC transporter ATP-binding protein [Bradyrhizobium symbiodeficiens]
MILSLHGISKTFGAIAVAQDVSLSIEAGEAVGIIGPNGAGKTSLFNLISGDMAPTSGKIEFAADDVTSFGSRKRSRLGVARTYQVPLPFTGLTVFENVLVGAMSSSQVDSTPEQRSIQILKRTGLLHRAETLAGTLTLLDRKRLELARALAIDPRLLLLDEIAGGLTDAECSELIDLIRAVHDAGTAVLWIEHVVHALVSVVKRLIVIDRGRIVADGDPHEVMRSSQVREIYLGVEPDMEALQ